MKIALGFILICLSIPAHATRCGGSFDLDRRLIRSVLSAIPHMRLESLDLDPRLFQDISAIEVPREIKAIRSSLQQVRGKFERVLYTGSGIDINSVVWLFDSREYIGIDNRPLLIGSLGRLRDFNSLPKNGSIESRWNKWQDIDALTEAHGALPLYLLRLVQAGFRPRGVSVFEETRLRSSRHHRFKGIPISSGVIEFDQGEGTPIRRYWHFDAQLEYGYDSPRSKSNIVSLVDFLRTHPPDGFLVKGSDWVFKRNDFKDFLVELFESGQGVLLEGASAVGVGEFFGGSREALVGGQESLSYRKGFWIHGHEGTTH